MKSSIMKPRIFILSLTAAWCIGISIRFLLMGTSTYQLNLLDTMFDWGILLMLGIILLIYNIYEVMHNGK